MVPLDLSSGLNGACLVDLEEEAFCIVVGLFSDLIVLGNLLIPDWLVDTLQKRILSESLCLQVLLSSTYHVYFPRESLPIFIRLRVVSILVDDILFIL